MIQSNLLELLGAFFLGAIVALASVWTFVGWAIEDHEDDDLDDGPQPPTEKHA